MLYSTKEKYDKEIIPEMMRRFRYKNIMQVPKLKAIVVNRGVSEVTENPKALDSAARELGEITGQKPLLTRARKSISAFKIRAKQLIGCKVTLRGHRMYQFLTKFIHIALPKIRDFRGVPNDSFDGRGNYSFGVKEQLIFPEVNYEKVDKIRGMDITLVTTAKQDEEAKVLLTLFGMPFRK